MFRQRTYEGRNTRRRALLGAKVYRGKTGNPVWTALARCVAIHCAFLCVVSQARAQSSFSRVVSGAAVEIGVCTYGISWGDFDNDGAHDLFVATPLGSGVLAEHNFLYRNLGDGVFEPVTTSVIATDLSKSYCGSWGDYDNDGDLDLFVANTEEQNNHLYRNDGSGEFISANTSVITNDGGSSWSASWVDYDNDGLTDLFVANFFEEPNFLYRNVGNGNFEKIIAGAIVEDRSNSVGCAWGDYDNDGFADLFVANGGANNPVNSLYRNNGDGTFVKITAGPIVSDRSNSSGGSWGDYDNDGDLDLFVANTSASPNALYRNNGDGTFDIAQAGAITAEAHSSLGSSWADFDNDGFLDMYVVNGHIRDEENRLYRNNGDGTFSAIETGEIVGLGGLSRSAGWCDANGDGFADLFVTNHAHPEGDMLIDDPDWLFLNEGNANHWVSFRLKGRTANASAFGAVVRVRTSGVNGPQWLMRHVAGQTGLWGQNGLDVSFGLGAATSIDSVIIEWPGNERQILTCIPVDSIIEVEEGLEPPQAGRLLLTAEGATSFCRGDSVILHAPEGFEHFRWSNGAVTRSITVTEAGEYSAVAQHRNGCSFTSRLIRVETYEPPTPTMHASTTELCEGETALLSVDGDFLRYSWSNGATSPAIIVDRPGIYRVEVVDRNGCKGVSQDRVIRRKSLDITINGQAVGETLPLGASLLHSVNCSDVEITNNSNAPVLIEAPRFARNVEFSISLAQFPMTLEPAITKTMKMCFAPSGLRKHIDTLYFGDPDCGGFAKQVSGIGIARTHAGSARCDVALRVAPAGVTNRSEVFVSAPYPNPTPSTIVLESSALRPLMTDEAPAQCELYDRYGRRRAAGVYRARIVRTIADGSHEMGTFTIDVAELPQGAYFVRINSAYEAVIFQVIVAR